MDVLRSRRTTVNFGFLAQRYIDSIRSATGHSQTRVLEDALACYAVHLTREADKRRKAGDAARVRTAEEEGARGDG